MRTINLTAQDFFFLARAAFLPERLQNIVCQAQVVGRDRYLLKLSDRDAEEFRSAFTEHLAIVGFDRDYNPTEEGRRLEELVDKFYVQK